MKHELLKNKELMKIRKDITKFLTEEETEEICDKYLNLKKQYKLLQIAKRLEHVKIPKIDIFFLRFITMFLDFLHWKIYDFIILLIEGKKFNFYGVTCFCGKQGSGKTIGVVREIEKIKALYPDAIICTNINYTNQDYKLTSWLQLLTLRNGEERRNICYR